MSYPNIPVNTKCEKCGQDITISYKLMKERSNRGTPILCNSCMKIHKSEKIKSAHSNKSPEQLQEISNKKKLSALNYWNSISEDDRNDRSQKIKDYINSLSPNELAQRMEKVIAGNRAYWDNMSNEEKSSVCMMHVNHMRSVNITNRHALKDKLESDNEFAKMYSKSHSRGQKRYWDSLTPEERDSELNHRMEALRRWRDNLSEDEKQIRRDKLSFNNREYFNNMSEKDKKEFSENMRAAQIKLWEEMDDETRLNRIKQIHRNIGRSRTSLNDKFESAFRNSYLSKKFSLVPEYLSINISRHHWDYGIYSKENNELVMVVDLDGEYYHADNCDYTGTTSNEEYDEARFLSVPDNVRCHIIYEDKFAKSFEMMIKLVMTNYESIVNSIFYTCRHMDFPYPHYSDIELNKSWRQLLHLDAENIKDLSIRNREGDRLIQHFHPSIWHAHTKGNISPYEAWYNDKLLMKVIRNRIIYVNILNPNKILQGFNVSKIAPKVSVFSAGRAKLIINKYLSEYDTIFDPFSGFGGRMLGTVSLGKRYIGQDIATSYVSENVKMASFLNILDNVLISNQNVLYSSGEYPCLFTCPPYGDKEIWDGTDKDTRSCDEWIDICLKRFKCNRYVFVVDHTEKHKDCIVDVISNKSHFGRNNEYVIKIDN